MLFFNQKPSEASQLWSNYLSRFAELWMEKLPPELFDNMDLFRVSITRKTDYGNMLGLVVILDTPEQMNRWEKYVPAIADTLIDMDMRGIYFVLISSGNEKQNNMEYMTFNIPWEHVSNEPL